MTPGILNLRLLADNPVTLRLLVTDAAGESVDLSTADLRSALSLAGESRELVCTVTDAIGGLCEVSIPSQIRGMGNWEFRASLSGVINRILLKGLITVSDAIQPGESGDPLAETYTLRVSETVKVTINAPDLAYLAQRRAEEAVKQASKSAEIASNAETQTGVNLELSDILAQQASRSAAESSMAAADAGESAEVALAQASKAETLHDQVVVLNQSATEAAIAAGTSKTDAGNSATDAHNDLVVAQSLFAQMPIPIETTIEAYHAMPFHEQNHLYFCMCEIDGKKKIVEAWRGDFRISPPYEFYLEYNPDGTVTPRNCELLTDATWCMAYAKLTVSSLRFARVGAAWSILSRASNDSGTIILDLPMSWVTYAAFGFSTFTSITISAPLAGNVGYMCQACENLEHLVADMKSVTSAEFFVPWTKVKSLAFDFPLLSHALGFCCGNQLLESVELTTSKVTNAETFASDCPKLTIVPTSWPVLVTGKGMFKGCSLSAATINAILESLPTWTDGKAHVITFTGCPGAAKCDPSIGTEKGWTVEL